tara:strand:+ start:490 stop:771 length:282 start_codon:yes stop_codon:yes gene_type:complete
MIKWSKLPKTDLTIAAAISLETAGFIGNKYGELYGFTYFFSVALVIFLMISLDAAKTNKEKNIGIPKNNIRPIESKKAIENTNILRQLLWQRS